MCVMAKVDVSSAKQMKNAELKLIDFRATGRLLFHIHAQPRIKIRLQEVSFSVEFNPLHPLD